MKKLLTLSVILLALAIFGCGSSEEQKSTQDSKQTTTEKVAETAKSAVGEVKEVATAVADKAGEIEKQTEPAIKEAAADTKAMAEAAAEKTDEMVTDAKDATMKAADTAGDTVKSAAVATTMAAGEAVDAAKQAVSPETIVLEASYGNITFPHAMHSSAFDCNTCHGEGTPGLFGLDKEKAHVLCKDCHKEQGVGPTSCKGCHKQ
jgi:hypothetical protein